MPAGLLTMLEIPSVQYMKARLPSGLSLSLDNPTIQTGGELTLSGSFNDRSQTIHFVFINWGDGSPNTTLCSAAGQTTFQANPNSPTYSTPGKYAITVTISGPDGNTTTMTRVTVNGAFQPSPWVTFRSIRRLIKADDHSRRTWPASKAMALA